MFFSNKGVLGINARNLLYTRPYNKKKAIKLADDKIKTKQFLSTRGVAVPKLFGIIRSPEELEKYSLKTLPQSFVIKPNNGYGGEGIIPIVKRNGDVFITASGKELTEADLREHIREILDGRYSISNVTDSAFFEQYIVSDDVLGKFSYAGLPDIRIIVHNLIPVMAMLRLPTKESNGKANLHLGAVGVGIDIAKGEATNMILKNKIINKLPNGKGNIKGVKIPFWDEMLLIASNAQLITNLGYMAVDICLDKKSGPVLLEINARAGLSVQVANLAPLRKRLERIQGVKVTTPQKGIRIAKDMFGNTVEKEIEHLSGKEIIGNHEEIEVLQKTHSLIIDAQISTVQNRTTLDRTFAEAANLLNDSEYDKEKSTLKLKFSLKNRRIQTIVDIADIDSENYKIIIGQRDLKNFLIDMSLVAKNKSKIPSEINTEESEINFKTTQIKIKENKIDYKKADKMICEIDNKVKLLYHINPQNLLSEIEKVKKDINYNPQFQYKELKFDEFETVDELTNIKLDQSTIGKILSEKRNEIILKMQLIGQIGEKEFTKTSIKLFGNPTYSDIKYSKKVIKNEINKQSENTKKEELFNENYALKEFEKIFKYYNLENHKVKIRENIVSRCLAGKNGVLSIKKGSTFTKQDIKSLIIHEIETHMITTANGNAQYYSIFGKGTANFLETQEGMAMYNVSEVLNQPIEENIQKFILILSIYIGQSNSFSGTLKKLINLGVSQEKAIKAVTRVKRGFTNTAMHGSFTKDYIYYNGYKKVKNFIDNGGKMKDLYMGKINLDQIEEILKIKEISKPKTLPRFLKEN